MPSWLLCYVHIMHAFVHSCSNGLTSLFHSHGSFPLVSLQFWVQTGSIHESPHAGSGLSHLLEHMVFKGTRNFSGEELAQRVQSLGGSWNAYTSTDRTVYHIDGPAEHWREFLHLLTELVFFPSFPQEEWEREREVIRREMEMYDDDPSSAAYHALNETLFHAHPRRLPVIGYRKQFDALNYEDMRRYHEQRYCPAKVFVVCAVGASAVCEEDFSAAVEQELSPISASAFSAPIVANEPIQWGPRLHRVPFAQPTSTLMLAWRIPNASHPDAPALSLLSHILGEGRAAWLQEHFHDELGMAHDISASVLPSREGEGAFVIEADCEHEDRDELRDALLAYVEETLLSREDVELGLHRALRQLRVARVGSLASVQGCANLLAMSWHLTRNSRCMEEWQAALALVNSADILRVAARYLTRAKLCEVSVDPLGAEEDSSAKVGEVQLAEATNEITLEGGLRLVARRDNSAGMLHATLALGAGCGSESFETSGINNLLTECLLKGTQTRSASVIAQSLENLGASIHSAAGNNTILLRVSGLKEDLETMLKLLADVAINPLFDADTLETERKTMLADILDAQQDPVSLAFQNLRTFCFGNQGYGLHPDGRVESVTSLKLDDLWKQYRRLFVASNAVLSINGDWDGKVEQLAEQLQTLFADMPRGKAITRKRTLRQKEADEVISCDKEQAILALALPGLALGDKQMPAFLLLQEWLRDMSGPIFTEIREKRGLAYFASASSLTGWKTGCLYFYLGTSPDKLSEARVALEECLESILKDGITEEQFERTRVSSLSAHMLQMQSSKSIGENLALDSLMDLGVDFSFQMPEMMSKVSHAELQALIKRLFGVKATRTWVSVQAKR